MIFGVSLLHTVTEANKIIPCIPVDHLLFPRLQLIMVSIQMEVFFYIEVVVAGRFSYSPFQTLLLLIRFSLTIAVIVLAASLTVSLSLFFFSSFNFILHVFMSSGIVKWTILYHGIYEGTGQ
jgi:hypothetical protein